MSDADLIELPAWAAVGEKRRAHIARVTALLLSWADTLALGDRERATWRDAGAWHDALRDAGADELRAWAPGLDCPLDMLHGPAAANRLERDGEQRADLLSAIRWHTSGCASWARAGRALYMADYLEPGRKFARADRAFLAAHVPHDFGGVFRQVVRQRLEWALREGNPLLRETVELWNSVS